MRILKIDTVKRKLVFGEKRTRIGWTLEIEEDLKNNVPSGLDLRPEIISALLDALDKEYDLTSAEKTLSKMILDKTFEAICVNRS